MAGIVVQDDREIRPLIDALLRGEITDADGLQRAKIALAKEAHLAALPSNAAILALLPPDRRRGLEPILRRKPQRTLSGVAPVAVMTNPAPCPHGTCAYCPGGPASDTPQSYTGREPAALRAAQHGYDPYRQVMARLGQYAACGHDASKVDLIVMGGTFTARDPAYQRWFVRECLAALNGEPPPPDGPGRSNRRDQAEDLAAAQQANESAPARCIGLTVETRPDQIDEAVVDRLLAMGATRVELGVQALDDGVLASVGRGHGVEAVVEATRLLKMAGLKVLYHLMPGLPGRGPEEDLADLRRVFEDDRFRPDMLKLYPTLVVPGTRLHAMWEEGQYEPLDNEAAVSLIAEMKALVPPWCRIQRIQRDIPLPLVTGGPRSGNLRELARRAMALSGRRCACIRCRELPRARGDPGTERVVHAWDGEPLGTLTTASAHGLELEIRAYVYAASGGTEVFLAAEAKSSDALAGFARLRSPGGGPGGGALPGPYDALLRELKVFGPVVGPGDDPDAGEYQHRGLGGRLLDAAETFARNRWDARRLAVNSGVGVRGYYRARGYALVGPYMVKDLSVAQAASGS